MIRNPFFRSKEVEGLGNRDYHGVNMMAGYTSSFVHQKVMKIILKYLPKGTSILDIGAGHGAFSKRLLENGYDVTAIEKYAEFLVKGLKNLKVDLNEDWSKKMDKNYDGAVAIEIIEHLENPYHFMRQVHNILKSNGYFIITSPNTEDLLSRWHFLFYGKFNILNHQDHKNPIFEQSIIKLCSEVGFKKLYRTFDIDLLGVSSNWFKLLAKKIIKILSYIIARDRQNLIGRTNIWVLQKYSENENPWEK